MRDDAKIERYKKMKENERRRYTETRNRDRLVDMAVLNQEIEKEMSKEARFLGKVLASMTIFTVLSPWIIWWLGSR